MEAGTAIYLSAILQTIQLDLKREILDSDRAEKEIRDEESRVQEINRLLAGGEILSLNHLKSPFWFIKEEHALNSGPAKHWLAGIAKPVTEALLSDFVAPDPQGGKPFSLLLEDFHEELRKIPSAQIPSQILPLTAKYFSATGVTQTGISLYDLSRLSAAIRLCQFRTNGEAQQGVHGGDFLLVKGDVSGIQDFIFDVQSRGAAKSLKSRSFRIQALTQLAIETVLERLALHKGNLLYEGGGNFYILAPNTLAASRQLQEIQEEYSLDLLQEKGRSGDTVYLHIAATPFSAGELWEGMPETWQKTGEALNRDKKRRFAALFRPNARLEPGKAYDLLFTPQEVTNTTDRRAKEKEAFSAYTSQLKLAKGFKLVSARGNPGKYGPWFQAWGKSLIPTSQVKGHMALNAFTSGIHDFTYGVVELPTWNGRTKAINRELIQNVQENEIDLPADDRSNFNGLVEFEFLAKFAARRTGTEKLGVMKADIDGLGMVLKEGIREDHRSIAHIAGFSRALKWFFEGYINQLLDRELSSQFPFESPLLKQAYTSGETYRDNIYVLFSGGDDFFIVGAWDAVIQFGELLKRDFETYTGGRLSFSAGISVIGSRFPVVRFSELADEAEKDAKRNPLSHKNSVSLFNGVLTWRELKKARQLADAMVFLVFDLGQHNSIIRKVALGMRGYESLLLDIRQGRPIPAPRIWRFFHFLRSVRGEKAKQYVDKKLIPIFEAAFSEALRNPQQALNPWFIAVGTRWAEYLTKSNPQKDE